MEMAEAVEVGSRVRLAHLGDAEGTVRFVGAVHYAKGDDWVGVEMDDPVGKNNGSVKGQAYFTCDEKHGVFTRAASVQPAAGAKAAATAKESASAENRSADDLKRAGNERFVAKDYEGALELYSQALEQDPKNPILRGNRAACLLELGDPESALLDAEAAIDAQPSWWKGHMRRGKALKMLGEFEDAAHSLSKGAELVTDMQHRNELLGLAKECLQLAMQESAQAAARPEPAWLDAMPPDIAEQARADPMFMAALMEEMREMGMDMEIDLGPMGDDLDPMGMQMPPMPPGMMGGMDMDGAGMMGAMMGGMGAQGSGGIEKQRLKRPVLLVLPLHEAAKEGDLEGVRAALKDDSAAVRELDSHGRSPLAWACLGGHVDVALALLEAGAPVDPVKPPKENAASSKEASKGEEDDDDEEDDVAIPLHFAVRSGSKSMVDLLLDKGADPLLQEPILGHNALHQAVKSGNAELVFGLLDRFGAPLGDQEDLRGISPLCLACTVKFSGDRLELLRGMLSRGASVSAGVLFAALTRVNDNGEILQTLQEAEPKARTDANPPLRTATGATMLHLAAKTTPAADAERHLQMLLQKGMKPFVNDLDAEGLSALGAACQRKGYPGVIRALAKAGADVNAPQGASGDRPLHLVGNESNEPAWEALLALGADEAATNAEGKPPKLRPNLADKCSIM